MLHARNCINSDANELAVLIRANFLGYNHREYAIFFIPLQTEYYHSHYHREFFCITYFSTPFSYHQQASNLIFTKSTQVNDILSSKFLCCSFRRRKCSPQITKFSTFQQNHWNHNQTKWFNKTWKIHVHHTNFVVS